MNVFDSTVIGGLWGNPVFPIKIKLAPLFSFLISIGFLVTLCTACASSDPRANRVWIEELDSTDDMNTFRVYVGTEVWRRYPVKSDVPLMDQRTQGIAVARQIATEELKKIGRCPRGFKGPDIVFGEGRFMYSYFNVTCSSK